MTPARAGAIALASVLTLGACGTTYIDTDVTVPPTGSDATMTTLAPVDADTPVDDLLTEIATMWLALDTQIVERDGADTTLARIDELWAVAERQIRATDPDDVYPFQQAIDLAHSGVTRRRPADASKGYKIFTDVADHYLDD